MGIGPISGYILVQGIAIGPNSCHSEKSLACNSLSGQLSASACVVTISSVDQNRDRNTVH